jgi:hypothetical protein
MAGFMDPTAIAAAARDAKALNFDVPTLTM